jgi:LCP family protein required for cell wall assembly
VAFPAPPPSYTPRHARRRRRWPRVLLALGLVLVLLVGGGLAAFLRLNANISNVDLTKQLGARPEVVAQKHEKTAAMNLLLIGSDTRAGVDSRYGSGIAGARSDTTLLLHLSADRKSATAVSIPRDSWVEIPSCVGAHNRTIPAHVERFNSAYSEGGTACTIRTVESLTQIRVDHFVVIDFSGFSRMVDALGGVSICLPQSVDDSKSKLHLSAGLHKNVDGRTALAYVRTRYSLGNGSDIERIDRQQAFLSSVAQKATSSRLLLDPLALFKFLDAATKSITTDPGLGSLSRLSGLAKDVQHIGTSQISFITVPNKPYSPNPNVVVWKDDADALFEALRYDRPLPGTKAAATVSPAPTPTVSTTGPPLVTPPDRIRVRVLNATGVPGTGSKVADALRLQGYQVVSVGTTATTATTTVKRPGGYDESGRTLSAALGGAPVVVDNAFTRTLTLVVGRDYSGVSAVTVANPTAAPTPTPTITSRTADESICS